MWQNVWEQSIFLAGATQIAEAMQAQKTSRANFRGGALLG